jgi:Mrp family chromosome partitioning ATPase
LPSLVAIWLLPPSYLAAGSVLIGNQEPSSSSSSAAWIEKLGDPADLESQLLIITSRRMLRLAVARPGVVEAVQQECLFRSALDRLFKSTADCGRLAAESDDLLDYVAARYSVGGVGRSRIISISYRSPVPDVAFVLANALLITYLEDQRGENARGREAASAWLLRDGGKAFGGESSTSARASRLPGDPAEARGRFFEDLHRKVSDLEAERRSIQNSGRLVSLAEVPRAPYFPKRLPLLLAALTVAALLGTLGVFRQDITDRTIRRTGDLEALAGAPVLGVLPVGETGELKRSPRMRRFSKQQQRYPLREIAARRWQPSLEDAARGAYERLLLSGDSRASRCVLMASCSKADGKTEATLAVARAAAASGRNVLVAGCNFGRSELNKLLGVECELGLADVLNGVCEPQQAVISTPYPRLDAIGVGALDRDRGLMLADSDLHGFLTWARRYDLVLLDGPPSNLLADQTILARHCDGLVWCVRWGSTDQATVGWALAEHRNQRNKVLGTIVTVQDFAELRLYDRPISLFRASLETV